MIAWLLAATLAIAPAEDGSRAVATPAPADAAQVMAVPPELLARLPRDLSARGRPPRLRLERLVDFMFAPEPRGLGMTYEHDATHTVEQAYLTRKANCLGFTLLAIALARASGFEAYGQEIDHALSWQQEGDILFQYHHVNAGIRSGQDKFTLDVASDSVIAARPPRRIPDHRLLAAYYSNRAVELVQSEPANAARHIAVSLRQDPDYASAWNNAGVVHLRKGDPTAAETDYLRALELDPEHSGALTNLHAFYLATGDQARAERYRHRIEQARLRDPFHYFLRAQDYEKNGEYRQAIRQYRKAIALLGSEHRFYFGLARAYLHAGQARRAGEALKRAEGLSHGAARDRYQAKLEALRRQYGN